MVPEKRVRSLDAEIAELAGRQHGVISLRQLVDLGLSARGARARASAGRLHRVYRGVFAVGHRKLAKQGWLMAAVLSGGDGAVLSHQPAGAEWNLRAWSGRPVITVPRSRRDHSGIEVRSSSLPADERMVHDGIPITSVPRTIFDLATILDRHGLEQVIAEAEGGGLTDRLSLPDLLERYPHKRGVAIIRRILDEETFALGVTESELEDLFQRFVTEFGLPRPEVNVTIQLGDRFIRADCLWRDQRVIVELDGHRRHSGRRDVDSDKERDRKLLLLGWRVIRVTWTHLHAGRGKLARDLRAILCGRIHV
jgi:hypothetical protein